MSRESRTTTFCPLCRPCAECSCEGRSKHFWTCSNCGNQNSREEGECEECLDPANHTCTEGVCLACEMDVIPEPLHTPTVIERVEPRPMPFPDLKIFSMDSVKELTTMEKHGVEKDETKTKTASTLSGTCPKCGGNLTKEGGTPIDHCPKCGTEPFEKTKES